MKDSSYLKFSFDPSFLEHSNPESTTKDEFFNLLSTRFQGLKNDLDKIKGNSDVEFTTSDEDEIRRSETYKFFSDMGVISITKLKDKLESTGIVNEKSKNFIIQLLLQTRVGIFFKLIGVLGSLIITRTRLSNKPINIPTQNQSPKLRIKYNKFYDKIVLEYQSDIVFGYGIEDKNKPIVVGNVACTLVINSNLDTEIQSLYGIIYPYNSIVKSYTPNKLIDFKKVLTQFYQGLLGNPQPTTKLQDNAVVSPEIEMNDKEFSYNQPTPSKLKSLWNWVTHFFASLFKRENPKQPNFTSFRDNGNSNQYIQTKLGSSKKTESYQSAPNFTELFSHAEDSFKQIEEFTLLPQGTIRYKQVVEQKVDNELPMKTYPIKRRQLDISNDSELTSLISSRNHY